MKPVSQDDKHRCLGGEPGKELYTQYHDHEWAIPQHDDQVLFEFLILEGAQAGLNWETILKKREGYRNAFHDFDPEKVARMTDQELEIRCQDSSIIRNRRKIFSARQNARVFLQIQKEFGSFDSYLWNFVNHAPIINNWNNTQEVPTTTPESDALSKNLKKRGMSFVGSTIMYAYMKAMGLVDDHLSWCWKRQESSA